MSLSKVQETVKDREAWHAAQGRTARYDLVIEQQQQNVLLGKEAIWKRSGTVFVF